MTARELYEKYKEVFILVMETAGEETGNEVYKNVESIINSEKFTTLINEALDSGCRLDFVIVQMVIALVLNIHNLEDLSEGDLMKEYGIPMFELYLKKPTRVFCQRNGVPVIKELGWKAVLYKTNKNQI
jgi:hypothetical protein